MKKSLIFLFLILILLFISFLFYKKIEKFEDINRLRFNEVLELPIIDYKPRLPQLKKYLNDPNIEIVFPELLKDKIISIDNYRNKQIIYKLNNIKYKLKYNPKDQKNYIVSCLGIDSDNKIISITNKYLSYLSIINFVPFNEDIENLTIIYNELVNDNTEETIEEDVFLFIDCFAYAAFHNLDDIYNTLYIYKKNNMKCKLLVIKTTNFFYNQSLISLNKYFKIDYIFLDFNKNYLFKNLYITRQYCFLQKETKQFIDNEYLRKIINNYKGKPFFENIALIKYVDPTNISTWDTFDKSEKFFEFCKKHTIVDININYKNDLEYKIYLINKAKKIIVNYHTIFNVNIYKHCIDLSNKEIFVINGGNRQTIQNIDFEFEKIGDNLYNTYGRPMRGEVFNDIKTLDEVVDKLEKYF